MLCFRTGNVILSDILQESVILTLINTEILLLEIARDYCISIMRVLDERRILFP